jgi:hypothetical protein
MRIEDVGKLSSLQRFLYWITERHAVHVKRTAGEPRPWTDDTVLQNYFFTNPYRENDKTTVWFRENIRERLRNEPEVLMATVIFRWFNLIETGRVLLDEDSPEGVQRDLTVDWDPDVATERLTAQWDDGKNPVFTGAYMIKAGNGERGCKIPNVCTSIQRLWEDKDRLVEMCYHDCRLRALWEILIEYPNLGGFMAYEIVCDLRYTYLLEDATDVDTWANPGPGALRGLLRLEGKAIPMRSEGKVKRQVNVSMPLERMVDLLQICRARLPKDMPRFELREVEHSLCEWDKYERARTGEGGRMKRTFNGEYGDE